jgi:hypothetical protein
MFDSQPLRNDMTNRYLGWELPALPLYGTCLITT